jgi:carbon-monoxide dehydrogenase large subunit
MEIDTETGASTMRKYVAVDDIGTIINPLIVSGQVHGGLVQGISQALWEEAVHDESGTLVTASFVDYTLPTAADTISFETDHTTSPSTYTILGTKGVGEAGAIASTPAVVNAIVDALRPLGVDDVTMPCTPERVYKAIRAVAGTGDSTANDVSALGGDAARAAEGQPHFESGAPDNADPGPSGAGGSGEGSAQ